MFGWKNGNVLGKISPVWHPYVNIVNLIPFLSKVAITRFCLAFTSYNIVKMCSKWPFGRTSKGDGLKDDFVTRKVILLAYYD